MSVAVVLTHGIPPSRETLHQAVQAAALFVCADGAADHALAYGIEPHVVIGDLDSVKEETLARFPKAEVVQDADTETTDTEKAIRYVIARGGFRQILLLGASADRLDHVIGHLSLLLRYSDRIAITLMDERCRAFVGTETTTLDLPSGTVVSFFAVGGPAAGVTTQGLRYPLAQDRLELGVRDSISNVVEARPATVVVEQGRLLFFIVTDP
ncbi:MAG TPA: thiamine diphosphokinase [Candidatus Eisenbacteria bacterium]|jgi:thiamine pyrophosphokinase|nr:thiamine diphosphokinase [Candidatus Eisenbacteria bacterium]